MKKTSVIGTLLTLLMALLVLAAAVFFLADRQRDLEEELLDAQGKLADQAATREQLTSDLVVRQAAFDSAEGTRTALAAESAAQADAAATLEADLAAALVESNTLAERLADQSVEVFIFSPKEGAILPPGQAIELIIAARADQALDTVTATINEQVLDSYPAQGQASFTNRIPWTPAEEQTYVIELTARATSGISATTSIMVEAVYLSPEARQAALLDRVSADIAALRFPDGAPAAGPALQTPEGAVVAPGSMAAANIFSQTLFARAFDLVPADFDLAAFEQARAEQPVQVAYEAQVGAAVVFRLADAQGPIERWLVARQASAALQETYLDLAGAVSAAADQDSQLALEAMIEGEGAYLQHLYTQSGRLNSAETEAIRRTLALVPPAYVTEAPEYQRQRLLFPVQAGFALVAAAHESGGSEGLNALWQRPPRTSEQILHPDRYQAGEGAIPTDLAPVEDLLGEGWLPAVSDSLGEYHLGQYLARRLDAGTAAEAADGWGGGRYAVYWNPEDDSLVMLLRLAWDRPAERQAFEEAFSAYALARSGVQATDQPDGSLCWSTELTLCLLELEADTLVVQAPDQGLAQRLIATQRPAP